MNSYNKTKKNNTKKKTILLSSIKTGQIIYIYIRNTTKIHTLHISSFACVEMSSRKHARSENVGGLAVLHPSPKRTLLNSFDIPTSQMIADPSIREDRKRARSTATEPLYHHDTSKRYKAFNHGVYDLSSVFDLMQRVHQELAAEREKRKCLELQVKAEKEINSILREHIERFKRLEEVRRKNREAHERDKQLSYIAWADFTGTGLMKMFV